MNHEDLERGQRLRVLLLSTIAFTLMFNVWLMLGVLSIPLRQSLALSDIELEWLMATAILSGALLRLNFGIWADRFGGRNTFVVLLLVAAIPTYLFSQATTFPMLLACAFLFGLAGNSFSAGIAWNSAWFPKEQQGTALGVFGAGNVGASGTKLLVMFSPGLLTMIPAAGYLGGIIPGGWRFLPALYSLLLVVMAAAIWLYCPAQDKKPGAGRPLKDTLLPLRHVRVWRLSLYYVVVFGAYVAMSAYLPKYYIDVYGTSLSTAAMLTALFIFPASLLRPVGGWLSDRYGPRIVTYTVFSAMTAALALLCIPNGSYLGFAYSLDIVTFTFLLFVVACGMGIGKASVYKYIPQYFPKDVGAVGGLVGLLGGLGGFFLPPVFGLLGRWSGSPQTAFVALFALTLGSLLWLHLAIARIRAAERVAAQATLEPATAT